MMRSGLYCSATVCRCLAGQDAGQGLSSARYRPSDAASSKYTASSPRTERLNSLLWATMRQPEAMASSREGLVPPTLCPWK